VICFDTIPAHDKWTDRQMDIGHDDQPWILQSTAQLCYADVLSSLFITPNSST